MIGKIVKEITPNNLNHRNSEGDFIKLKNGDILFVYTRYDANADDHAFANLYAVKSTDGGETFSEPYLVLDRLSVNGNNVMSVSLMRMQNGDIGLYYLKKTDYFQCRLFLIRSADEGKTWSKEVLCTGEKGYYVVHNGRALRLASGKIIVPAAYVEVLTDPKDESISTDWKPAVFKTYASYDDGYTWVEEGGKTMKGTNSPHGLQEPCFVQLNDGRVWCLARTDLGRIYHSYSSDEGKTWDEFTPSWFTSAISPITVKRVSKDRLVSFWTPIPVFNGVTQKVGECWTWGRNPYVCAISTDDGKNFSSPYAIETDKNRGFGYTAFFETDDGDLLVAYCAGGEEDGWFMLNRLRIRKIYADELVTIEKFNKDVL